LGHDRIKALLEEMDLLRQEDDQARSADISTLSDDLKAESVARSFMSDAGMNFDNREHIIVFLNLIAAHLLIGRKDGHYPYDKFVTLTIAYGRLQKRQHHSQAASRTTLNSIATNMHKTDLKLNGLEPNTVRMALERAIDTALAGNPKLAKGPDGKYVSLTEDQIKKLNEMIPALRELRSAPER